ncbi:acyl carrier protein [Maricurvus nonylphenolicus]|uniref:acyl carrier protein n=1 Tax=Maricurvus nonylphenolicus TaxID=1008307 RepID=UPI0036F2415B
MSNIHDLKSFIVEEFIPDTHQDEISDDLELIKSGILDSLSVLKLVAFIEDRYDIALDPSEIDPDNLNSIRAIDALISKKLEQSSVV